MSHAAVFEMPAVTSRSAPRRRRRHAPSNVLLASLAAAAVTIGLSVAAINYALTHIPEVDPNAEAAPVAAVAAIAAQASLAPGKLEVLTPPVYGPGVIDEAPAAPFVPPKPQTTGETTTEAVDMGVLAQADGVTQACNDPCAAEAGYIAPNGAIDTPPTMAADERETDRPGDGDAATDDDDGNAPPPPDMTVN